MRSLCCYLLAVVLTCAAATPTPPPPPPPFPPFPLQPGHRLLSNDSFGEPLPPEALGDQYCQLLLEAPVPPPADQVPWFCICSLCKTSQGSKGDRGDRGLPGSPGSPGVRGLTGIQGAIGHTGSQGLKGQKGDEGGKGSVGPLGQPGSKGDRGFKGDKGDLGMSGPPGNDGPKGDDGVCPTNCPMGPTGPPGPVGLPGPAGPRGLAGPPGPNGSTGLKGDPGTTGPAGAPGPLGGKGDAGPPGDCSCKDGLPGSPGANGTKGDKGDGGAPGPQGLKGDGGSKGDMGDSGFPGPPGPCMPAVQSTFSAALGASYPSANMPVAFNQVLSNPQGHYNPSLGIYTAPVNGTYVLGFQCTAYGRALKVGLFYNFQPVVKMSSPGDMQVASQQVVLHMTQGDLAWVMVKDALSNGMYTSGESSSTFSGFLLHPDSCGPDMLRDFGPRPPIKGTYSWGTLPTEAPTTPPPAGK